MQFCRLCGCELDDDEIRAGVCLACDDDKVREDEYDADELGLDPEEKYDA